MHDSKELTYEAKSMIDLARDEIIEQLDESYYGPDYAKELFNLYVERTIQ